MNTSSSAANEDEIILAQLVGELEKRGSVVLDEYVRRYPHLADKIRELVRLQQAVEESRPEGKTAVPARLGDFRIGRKIASGGMGDIYEAVQESLKRRVAVKIIRRGRLSPLACERFLREQQVLAQLHQTHIVPIHTAGEEGPLQYFAMPYIEGAALHHVIRVASQFSASQTGSKTPSLAKLAGMAASGPEWQVQDFAANPGRAVSTQEEQDSSSSQSDRGKPNAVRERPGRRKRLMLSPDYFRSVAQVMADAADAVHHAHGFHILHRDVKPSNIMVDTAGQCWLIDFGLAGYRRNEEGAEELKSGPVLGPGPATISGILGTPGYMAPEQFASKADVRTDVWGLGVTLYEMLTLHRAFPDSDDTARDPTRRPLPPSPGELIRNVPPDLAAICQRALQMEPARRYQTAQEFADDLRRWFRSEPTVARPARTPRRVVLWARRNRGWAAALAMAFCALLTLAGVEIRSEKARSAAAENEATAAKAREQDRQREFLILQLQHLRLRDHTAGWAQDAWAHVREIAKIRTDDELRDQAAATLLGIDAREVLRFPRTGASSVAFDPQGKRLLAGGTNDRTTGRPNEPARLWQVANPDTAHVSKQVGAGPVAFRGDGTPLQLVANLQERRSLLLWDVASNRSIREFTIPVKDGPHAASDLAISAMALTPDGSFLAAATSLAEGSGAVLIWESGTGQLLRRLERKASAIALSADGTLLAAGAEDGQITLCSLPNGKPVTLPQTSRTEILSLAFQRGPRRNWAESAPVGRGWLLAAGDAVGTVTAWDLATRTYTYCRGSDYNVSTLAFNPEGTLLASAGRGEVFLWDVANGRRLLRSAVFDQATGVTFSADGRYLAACSDHWKSSDSKVVAWELEHGRGMQTLRGLVGQPAQVRFSPDGRFLAVLAQNWQVAIWDVGTGQLLHLLDATVGPSADNAGMNFNSAATQLAVASGTDAKLWEVASGRELAAWKLPPGWVNMLAFHPSGESEKLLLFRVETEDGKRYPDDRDDRRQHPRVCKVRVLRERGPAELLWTKEEFNWRVATAAVPWDGRYFVVDGLGGPLGESRVIKAFDGLTGKELWSPPLTKRIDGPTLVLDPAGKVLAFITDDTGRATLVEMPSGKPRGSLDYFPTTLGPEAEHWIGNSSPPAPRFLLLRRGATAPILAFGFDPPLPTGLQQFHVSGNKLAWANDEGIVTVCDLLEVQRRLAELRLGW